MMIYRSVPAPGGVLDAGSAASPGLPLSYMQAIDGHIYDLAGVTGSYWVDALAGLAACAALAPLFRRHHNQSATAVAKR